MLRPFFIKFIIFFLGIGSFASEDILGNTPLHDAVRSGDMAAVGQLLKSKEYSVNKTEEYGYTPLHIAVRGNNIDIVKLLIKNKALVNTRDNFEDTPLIDAVRNNNFEISKILICNNAHKDVKDKNNLTLLHYASLNNNSEMIKMLQEQNLTKICMQKDEMQKAVLETVEDINETVIQVQEDQESDILDQNATEEKEVYEVLKIYQDSKKEIYDALKNEFENDLERWNAEIDSKNNITIRFKKPEVLFDIGSYELSTEFKNILSEFFPRFIKVLKTFESKIEEIRIEGHTSSLYTSAKNDKERYLSNAKLSQLRSFNVISYCTNLDDDYISSNLQWLTKVYRSNGLAYSKLIFNEDGSENRELSKRVEFRVISSSEEKTEKLLKYLEDNNLLEYYEQNKKAASLKEPN